MEKVKIVPIMHQLAREIDLSEAKLVAGSATVGHTDPAPGVMEVISESGAGQDTINGKNAYVEVYT